MTSEDANPEETLSPHDAEKAPKGVGRIRRSRAYTAYAAYSAPTMVVVALQRRRPSGRR